MRNLRRLDLRFASALVIFSPVYSAIFRPLRNRVVEKQPFPSIDDFLIDNPGASVSFIGFDDCNANVRFEMASQHFPHGREIRPPTLIRGRRPAELLEAEIYLSLKLRAIPSVWLRMRASLSRRPVNLKAYIVRLSA